MLLFLLFGTAVTQNITYNEDYFASFVKKYPVESISPCDNFYDHVCSAVPLGEISYKYKFDKLRAVMPFAEYIPLKVKIMFDKVKNAAENYEDNSADAISMQSKVSKHCSTNPEQCRDYGAAFTSNPMNMNVSLSSKETVQELTEILQKAVIMSPAEKQKKTNKLMFIIFLHGFLRALQDPKNQDFKHNFDVAQLITQNFFEQLQVAYIKRIESSPWVHNQHLLDHYRTIKYVEFRKYLWNSAFAEYFDILFGHFEKCAQSSFGWYKEELFLCAIHAQNVAELKTNLPWFFDAGLDINAVYYKAEMAVMPPNLMLATNNEVSVFATLGMVLGHELGHHIFSRFVTNTPALMPKNIDCLKEHRAHVCDISSSKCWSGNKTASEDAPDVVALAILTEMFAEQELKMDPSLNMSKEKFFFYSLVADWCVPKNSTPSGNVHSPSKERINALLMHSKFFHDTFECKSGDQMWQDPENFCNLLGPGSVRK